MSSVLDKSCALYRPPLLCSGLLESSLTLNIDIGLAHIPCFRRGVRRKYTIVKRAVDVANVLREVDIGGD